MADLIVYDEEYTEISKAYSQLGELFENRLSEYNKIIEKVYSEGVSAGDVHTNILLYGNKMIILSGQVKEIMNQIKTLCSDYIDEIDDKDNDLY